MALVTFINVPSHKSVIMTVYPPTGILSMSACLKEEGYRTSYIDADVCRYTPQDVVCQLCDNPPQLIGISLNVSQIMHVQNYLEAIQENFPQTPIVLGGPYVTGMGAKIFEDFGSIPYAVVKEGERAIVALVKHLEGRCRIEEIPNLLYRRDTKICQNKIHRIENLDNLPMPDYDLVKDIFHKYSAPEPSMGSPSIAIMCSRGCPYNCSFCSSPSNWDRKITYRSTDSVIKEVLYLKENFGVREVFFQDDTLNARPAWFFDLCNKIMQHRLNRSIFFKCPFRANKNILSEEILRAAKKANFWMIFFGVENGDQSMLDGMNKNIKIAEIRRAFRLMRKYGLASYASFMIGNYGETQETVKKTMNLIKTIMPDYGGVAIASPFPGSELHEKAIEKNLISINSFKEYQFGECILRTEALSRDEIISLCATANATIRETKKSLRYRFFSRKNMFSDIQSGIYGKEHWDINVHRTSKKARVVLRKKTLSDTHVSIEILADYPNIKKRPVKLTFHVNKHKNNVMLTKNEWEHHDFEIHTDKDSPVVLIEWQVDRTWNPTNFGSPQDDRELGITVHSLKTCTPQGERDEGNLGS